MVADQLRRIAPCGCKVGGIRAEIDGSQIEDFGDRFGAFNNRRQMRVIVCPQAARLRAALKVVAAVSPQPLLARGIKGPALASALEQARIEALTDSEI